MQLVTILPAFFHTIQPFVAVAHVFKGMNTSTWVSRVIISDEQIYLKCFFLFFARYLFRSTSSIWALWGRDTFAVVFALYFPWFAFCNTDVSIYTDRDRDSWFRVKSQTTRATWVYQFYLGDANRFENVFYRGRFPVRFFVQVPLRLYFWFLGVSRTQISSQGLLFH